MNEVIKNKIRQLYHFLKEVNQIRFRPVQLLSSQPKVVRLLDLPSHESIQIFKPIQTENEQVVSDVLLRIKRPIETKCPIPPETIVSWLSMGWDDPTKSLAEYIDSKNIIDEKNDTVTMKFDDDSQRVTDFSQWHDKRNAWLIPEQQTRKALRIFEVFYDISSTIEKDGEQFELLIADGHLSWQTTSTNNETVIIDHPILFKRIELRFDPNIPEFTVHETDRESELYSSLFVDLQNIPYESIRNRSNELKLSNYHPLGQDTDAFLTAFIQTLSPTDGQFLNEPASDEALSKPRLWRNPVVILRKRVAGIANAIDAIIDDIEHTTIFPPALGQITGTIDTWTGTSFGDEPNNLSSIIDNDDILLAKEANDAQLQIIRRLHHSGSVIVQGPPGTGKTHTIGNIIGHLLSEGKSILVTAQTAKALRVLRDKVPVALQPLCVSVLGSDQEARRQLESSIGSITERLSDSSDELLNKAIKLEAERKKILRISKELSHKLREALENEYREIVVNNQHKSPSEAAKFVSAHQEEYSWIPSPIKLGTSISLSEQELIRLYSLGSLFSFEEEQDSRSPLPEIASLPSKTLYSSMIADYQHILTCDLKTGTDFWKQTSNDSKSIEEIIHLFELEFSDDFNNQLWRPYAIVAGIHGGIERDIWEKLIAHIEKAVEAHSKYTLAIHHNPKLSDLFSTHKQKEIAVAISEHLKSGGKLGFIQLATRSEWRQFIKTTSVTAGQPDHYEHFQAIGSLAELKIFRSELELPWNNLIGKHINNQFETLGDTPELSCRAFIPEIRRYLDWHSSVWEVLIDKLQRQGLSIERIIASIPNEASQIFEYLLINRIANDVLPELLTAEVGRRKLREYEEGFKNLENLATLPHESGCIDRIVSAVHSRNTDAYAEAIEYIHRLHAVKPFVIERDALVNKLKLVAPGWAEYIFNRIPPHNQGIIPGNINQGWIWRQFNDTLSERDTLDAHVLQREIDKNRNNLREVTQQLIDAKAWGKQLERLQHNNSMRQALVGWVDTTKRLISTAKADRRQALLSEARKLMMKCVDAVPVWIMPISVMAESFDPRTTRFDVVIIDEASQADLNALIPLYMGKQIVVVGDHEQVTPLGVGTDQSILGNLRNTMLHDIPNAHLFDNMASIYDIGRQSFGDAIRLVEHFRCVPEIIAFSNQLSYEGSIRPLREANSTHIKPACVALQVDGVRDGDINSVEAKKIIDLIKAMIQHPAYTGKTIGIISMRKDRQVLHIQSMLHKEIDSIEIKERRILVGTSAEFQGDERDIIFLSMLDSPTGEGTLRALREGAYEQIKKRYNVAVSRARDQILVIHSFDPDLHLRQGDIRLQLLQHVKDPTAALRRFDQEVERTESDFEWKVLKRLTDAGFRVKTQWKVGYFRIDMVVEGGGKRLAIECDGDRWHPIEKLSEDMERQSILERLGWQFVRIRGSAFYRDQESAMKPVFERLNDLEIPQERNTSEERISDKTLLYELENIISESNGLDTLF